MDKDLFIIVGSNFGIATLIDIKSKIVTFDFKNKKEKLKDNINFVAFHSFWDWQSLKRSRTFEFRASHWTWFESTWICWKSHPQTTRFRIKYETIVQKCYGYFKMNHSIFVIYRLFRLASQRAIIFNSYTCFRDFYERMFTLLRKGYVPSRRFDHAILMT